MTERPSPPPRPRRWPLLAGAAALITITALVTLALLVAWSRPTNRRLWQHCQPQSVQYADGATYCLTVLERDVDWRWLPFTFTRHLDLFVARGPEATYGHVVDYGPRLADLDRAVVEWSPDGVTFTESSGHRLFIPAEAFLASR